MSFIKNVRQILMEMPELQIGTGSLLWNMYTNMAGPIHRESGVDIDVGSPRITKIGKGAQHETQYLVHGEDDFPKLRVEFNNHSFRNLPGKRGTYASLLHKGKTIKDNVYPEIKRIYKHELDTHDYVTTDANQLEGGKHTWKKLTKDFEDDGKNLYIHDGEKLTKVRHQDIINGEHSIWGVGPKFENTRLVVSNDSLQ